MRIDRFTSKLQAAIADAQSLAVGKDHNQIAPAHLILALLDQQGGSTKPLLAQMGIDVAKFREGVNQLIDRLAVVSNNTGDVQMSPELGRLLNLVDKYAQQRNDQFISSELVLIAAIDDKTGIGELMEKFGIKKDA